MDPAESESGRGAALMRLQEQHTDSQARISGRVRRGLPKHNPVTPQRRASRGQAAQLPQGEAEKGGVRNAGRVCGQDSSGRQAPEWVCPLSTHLPSAGCGAGG